MAVKDYTKSEADNKRKEEERQKKLFKIFLIIHIYILILGLLFFIMGLCLTYAKELPDLRFWWMTSFGVLALTYIVVRIIAYFLDYDHYGVIIYVAIACTGVIMFGVGLSFSESGNQTVFPAMWITGLTCISYAIAVLFAYLGGGGNAFIYWLIHSALVVISIYCIVFGGMWASDSSDGWWLIGLGIVLLVYVGAVFGYQFIKHSERKNWFTKWE